MNAPSKKLQVREYPLSSEELDVGLAAVQKRHGARRRQRQVAGASLGALLCAAAALLALRGTDEPRAPIAVQTSEPAKSPDKEVVGPNEAIRFPDGSGVELLTETAQIRMVDSDNEAPQVELLRGSARFNILTNNERTFTVLASPIQLVSEGAQVSIFKQDDRARVVVEEGQVRVALSASAEGKDVRELNAGEAAWFESEDSESAPSPGLAKSAEAERVASSQKSAREEFRAHHKRAEYSKAYALLTTGAFVVPDSDLMLAADAARFSGHPTAAIRYLSRVGSGSSLAATAAFTRGRLYLYELGDAARAAQAFAETRKLAGGGPLAEDALFREIESRVRAGQSGQAKTLASLFARSYPNSGRLKAVAKLTENK